MGDRLTQLQDAVDQASLDSISRDSFANKSYSWPHIDSLPPDEFRAGMVELSQDLIVKEQQIEVLISSLPGLDNSEMDQERYIKELEEDLKIAEAQRLESIKEKDQILSELDSVIRSIRRP
ncbi:mediator-RNA polymerase II transcription subunit 21 [Fusarium pseudocircinatum]|uniref:Mediator of RNA polymerase II transcription subunit 21 n=1 Tax=Fusarium pseudocircinatum TaxID=56676 RepID=A0A8H5NX46_9HYPO|nr:mediator-RNA polymerase II transcription subunit 21 [Fusarium pseudocircinatum]